jgi:hypothetical protein
MRRIACFNPSRRQDFPDLGGPQRTIFIAPPFRRFRQVKFFFLLPTLLK